MTPGHVPFLGLLAMLAVGSAGPEPERLTPGKGLARELTAAETSHAFALLLASDVYVQLRVQPRDLNAELRLYGPEGEPLLAVDEAWTDGPEELVWVTAEAGTFRVDVRRKGPSPRPARYELEVSETRPATAADRDRAEAARARADGRRLLEEQTAERTREAAAAFEKALGFSRSAGDPRAEAAALAGLGRAATALSDYPVALDRFDRALGLWQRLGDDPQQAVVLNEMAVAFLAWSQFDEALECAGEAVALFRQAGDREGEGQALLGMAYAHSYQGQPALAIAAVQQALALLRPTADRRTVARALSVLAGAYYHQEDQERGIEVLNEVLPLTRAEGDRRLEAENLNDLGMMYVSLGDGRRGLPYLEQALALCRQLGERTGEAIVLANLALVHRFNGDAEREIGVLRESQALMVATGDRRGQGLVAEQLGVAHLSRGDLPEARRWLEESLAIPETRTTVRNAALFALAEAMLRANDLERAEELALQGLQLAEAPERAAARPLYVMAHVEQRRGDLAEAHALIDLALTVLEDYRARLSTADLRAAYQAAAVRGVYETSMDILMARHRADPAGGFDAMAFLTAERGRARSLVDLLVESRANIREGVDAGLLERGNALRDALSAASARSLQARARNDPSREALEREVDTLTRELDQVDAEIKVRSPRYAALTRPEPIGVPALQALLDEDTLVLEYALARERSYAWLVGPRSLESATLPPQPAIEAAARRVLTAMEGKAGDAGAAAAELSRLVLAPFAGRLAARRLVVVADGALQYVPFAALPDPGDGQPLVGRLEVLNLPSASTLAVLRNDRPAHASASGAVAVLADPVFDQSDERLHGARGAPPSAGSTSLTRAVADAGLSGPIPRLPFTRREAEAILSRIPAGSSLAALDFDASRATVMDPSLARYRIVHFATHGFFNTSRPELSGLVLSLFDREGHSQPGFLTAADAFNLKLAADLVVLSGCRTALGREVRGEGLVGLTRGFMYAGASRVLASLWQVDDAATAALMSRFYSALLAREPASPAAALRAAQLDLMKQPRFRHPFYWAGFQLQGDWK